MKYEFFDQNLDAIFGITDFLERDEAAFTLQEGVNILQTLRIVDCF